jgi:hypothetical protein
MVLFKFFDHRVQDMDLIIHIMHNFIIMSSDIV